MKKWFSIEHYKKIYRFLGKRTVLYLIGGVFVGLLLFITEISFAYSLQAFLVVIGVINTQILQIPSWIPHTHFTHVLLFLAILGTLRGFLQYQQCFLSNAVLAIQMHHQHLRVLRWALHTPSVNSGEVMTLLSGRTGTTSDAIGQLQSAVILSTSCIFLLAGLFYLAVIPTLSAFFLLILLALIMRKIDHRILNSGRKFSAQESQMHTRLFRNIKNLLLMRIYGTQNSEEAKIKSNIEGVLSSRMNHVRYVGMKFAIPQIAGVFMICFITLIALKTGKFSSALLLSYFYIFIRFVQSFAEVTKSVSNINFSWPQMYQLAKWWADHSYDGIRNPVEIKQGSEDHPPFDHPIGWKFSNVSFGYKGGNGLVLKALNLKIEPSETLVITGPSGVGKSTLLNLLLGTLRPNEGKIQMLMNGASKEITDVFRARLLLSVGYVGPESFLLDGTIYENITYGLKAEPSHGEIDAVLQKAECHFIYELPKGLNHTISEQGEGLSAGQKQRLSLMRALLRKPKVLILDEATANLDVETEARLAETLSNLKNQMTIIAATHREGLLKIADQRLRL